VGKIGCRGGPKNPQPAGYNMQAMQALCAAIFKQLNKITNLCKQKSPQTLEFTGFLYLQIK
jgi:hypothetical protein